MTNLEKIQQLKAFRVGWIADEMRSTRESERLALIDGLTSAPVRNLDDVISLIHCVGRIQQSQVDLLEETITRLELKEQSDARPGGQ